jgi:hypothetical protein
MFFNIRRSSFLFDLSIVLIDLAIGFIASKWFEQLLGEGSEKNHTGLIVSLFIILTLALYFWALIKFRNHFKTSIFFKASSTDHIALFTNAIIAGAMIPICFQAFWPDMPMGVFITLIFSIMIGWYIVHYRTFNLAEKQKTSEASDKRTKIKILLMMLPFSAASLAPTSAIASMLRLANTENNLDPLWFIISIVVGGFCVTILGWITAYLPRRMTRAALELPSSGKTFFWMLLLCYILQIIPWK